MGFFVSLILRRLIIISIRISLDGDKEDRLKE